MSREKSGGRAYRIRKAATALAFFGGVLYGVTNIPAPIEGIPFVQVIPALVLGALSAAVVDLVGAYFVPQRHEHAFLKVGALLLLLPVALFIHNVFSELGLLSRDADEHYSLLADDCEK